MADSPEEEHQLELDSAAYHADQLTLQMAIAQNVATNGRWFSALLVLANCAGGEYRLAALAAVPVGLAAIFDQLPDGSARSAFSLAIYGLSAIVAVLSIIALG